MKTLGFLFKTKDEVAPLVLRLLLAAVFFPHGAQKVLGLFGGHGFGATMQMFTQYMHIPAIFAFLAIMTEFCSPILLVLGFLGRLASLGLFILMSVAVFTVHIHNGFFMNWSGQQKGEGFEYHLLVIAITLALMIKGSGKWSLDYMISKRSTVPDKAGLKVQSV